MKRIHARYLDRYDPDAQERLVRDGFLNKIKTVARRVPFARDALAAYFAMLDPKVPALTRAAVIAPLAYFVIPTDLIPDFLLGIGYTDDALVFVAALKSLQGKMTEAHYARADAVLDETSDGQVAQGSPFS